MSGGTRARGATFRSRRRDGTWAGPVTGQDVPRFPFRVKQGDTAAPLSDPGMGSGENKATEGAIRLRAGESSE